MEKFKDTGDDEHVNGDDICGAFGREENEGQQDPEGLIEDAGAIIVEPPITRP